MLVCGGRSPLRMRAELCSKGGVFILKNHYISNIQKPRRNLLPSQNDPQTHIQQTSIPKKMASLQGKVIAITGAASGIGLALSKICASRGAKLALADIQQEALDKNVQEIKSTGVEVVGTKVDVSSNESVDNWINSTVKHFGRLDGAANVAAADRKFVSLSDFADTKNEEWDFLIGVNLTGLMYCLRAELRVMGHGASVVNVSSIAGLIGRQGIGAYSASKAGVVGMTRTAAKDVGGRGIRVNAIAP
jgi:NAD(P)-dependent dehydrogenase (short-subunit alcohol dehydrogenase family)